MLTEVFEGNRRAGLMRARSDGYEGASRAVFVVRRVAVTPQRVPDAIECRALGVEPHEGVDVHGHADRAVAQDLHDHAGISALFVEQGRARVTQVMEAGLTDPGTATQRLEGEITPEQHTANLQELQEAIDRAHNRRLW